MEALWKRGNAAELRQRLVPRIAFGTAGLRARMGAGWACINELIVVQTTQVSPHERPATDRPHRAPTRPHPRPTPASSSTFSPRPFHRTALTPCSCRACWRTWTAPTRPCAHAAS